MIPTIAAINNHIFTFFHHMADFKFFDALWNFLALLFNASVLSTNNSIFSPRANT